MTDHQPLCQDYDFRHPTKARTYSREEKEALGVKEEDKKAELFVNRIQGEMEDLVTLKEVELSTSQDSTM